VVEVNVIPVMEIRNVGHEQVIIKTANKREIIQHAALQSDN
jgi:hypothetical protein